jgi:hypothetical protein
VDVIARIPLTIRHRFDFTAIAPDLEELDAAGWDALRATESPFGMNVTIDLSERAEAVEEVIRRVGARRVCSYGVGAAVLEASIQRSCDLTVTEYAPATVGMLRERFPNVAQHDLLDGPLHGFDLHILHRVDTELADSQWRDYFAAVDEPHLVVVSGFVTGQVFRQERDARRRGVTVAGWLRTEPRFRRLLPRSAERVQVADLPGYLIH